MLTYSTAEAAKRMGAPSERWLIDQLRSGRFPGRKIGRTWRMTDSDIGDAIDLCGSNPSTETRVRRVQHVGLTPTSRKKVVGM